MNGHQMLQLPFALQLPEPPLLLINQLTIQLKLLIPLIKVIISLKDVIKIAKLRLEIELQWQQS